MGGRGKLRLLRHWLFFFSFCRCPGLATHSASRWARLNGAHDDE
jgi:hypothetical protein